MDSNPRERRPSSTLLNKTSKKKFNISKCCKSYWKELKSRSLNVPTILLLIYAAPIPFCRAILINIIKGFINGNKHCAETEDYYYIDPNYLTILLNALSANALFFLVPFCGWLSDTKIGRGNAIYLSLWLGWIGTLLRSIGCCLQYDACNKINLIGRLTLSGIAVIFLITSLAFMFTNILAYGIDQMIHFSSAKIRAFIRWFVWAYFLCYNIHVSFDNTLDQPFALLVAVVAFALFCLSLCLHFLFKGHFEHIPIPNPYKIIFKVLKSSYKRNHTRMRQRSAFTYWGKEPSRLDLAKERYGGSFTHEEVENVKTFLRILAVLAALFPFLIVSDSFYDKMSTFVPQYKEGDDEWNGYIVQYIGYGTLLVLIPVCELIILPLFPKFEYFLLNPLRGIGVANFLILLSVISLFLIDLIGRPANDVPCNTHIYAFNQTDGSNDATIPVSYGSNNTWILVIPAVLGGTSLVLNLIYLFEFLCSQAPFGMLGMIIGLFWFMHGFFDSIGSYIAYITTSVLSCTSWTTIPFGVIAVVGLVLYLLIARWYVNRIRDTDLDLRAEVENNWEQRLIKENLFDNNNQTDYDTFIISSIDEQ